jgi:hypothetical protein
MGYLAALQRLASGGIGRAPAANTRNIATPPLVPPAQSHVEAPPYDVAQDPGWAKILDPADHALRNFLNELSPEHRQMLQQRVQQFVQNAVGNIPGVRGATDTAKAIQAAMPVVPGTTAPPTPQP